MVKYDIIFYDEEGEWAGTIRDFKTKKEAIECAKANLKLNSDSLAKYKIDEYIDNPYFGMWGI